ncbi:hypothetical protein EON76_01740 [bacterium]|nr:MAG: hypothetical protein EON76_01740 [bacterium]
MKNIENTPQPFDDQDQYDSQLVEDEIAALIGTTTDNETINADIAKKESEVVALTQDGEEYNPETGHFIDKEVHDAALTAMAHMAVKDYRVVADYGQGADIEPIILGQPVAGEVSSDEATHSFAS